MDSKTIVDFVINDRITGFFSVRKKVIREFARGRFVSLELGDCSGRIGAVCWEPDQFCLDELEAGMVVKVRGGVGEYHDRAQLTISQIRLANDDEYALEDILPHSSQPVEQRRSRLMALAERIENSYIKSLADAFLNDESFLAEFLVAPAGKLWHHAYVGGLSEHSANVAELALDVSSYYDFLNKDYLIFGGLFHDVGKMTSYSAGTMIDFTDAGRLVGHICLADHWICERAARIDSFPEMLLVKLRHLILSHQGELEYATPVVPQIPEAFVVYYCDEIDSKMGAIERIRTRQGGAGWSEYVKLLNRYLYFGEKSEE
ncbi:MAG: HD domain-containing protein [candidate division Zixibacteria bacterium]|nr:HD domain-containing protein [candidate division Zixibacteria bacterium]